ncbi:hypothetical protein QVD17_10817 [Tagetes erecta]|uniref:Protein kinase domain-containing protein n=1 Tax=Tagetes erecta TaxID=13708 RepID=A0AAD8L436_TARER|nr:hypothetical protein QVD17_10817 [Tagetes erecta]
MAAGCRGKHKKHIVVEVNLIIELVIIEAKDSTMVVGAVKISSKNRIILADFGSIERCLVRGGSDHQVSSVDSFVCNVSDDVGRPEENDQEIGNEQGQDVVAAHTNSNDSSVVESSSSVSSVENGSNGESSSLSTEDGDPANVSYSSSESDDDTETTPLTGIDVWPRSRSVAEFERLCKIGEGTYGVVYKARDKKTREIVALKKVKMGSDDEGEGFPVTALREINIISRLRHPCLVQMKEVVTDGSDGVYMVMEYVAHELNECMKRMRQPFTESEVKRLMLRLLEGVSYLHDNYVMHRDLKPTNLLLNKDGELKICDFGMSRLYASPLKPYTPWIAALWYKAPELLLGMEIYTTAVDMWSIGCLMAEFLSNNPLFEGTTELEQINCIFRILGTPDELIWPGYSKLPGFKPDFVKKPALVFASSIPVSLLFGLPTLSGLGCDLLKRLLIYDPDKRITAKEALTHGWFCEAPLAAERVRICK